MSSEQQRNGRVAKASARHILAWFACALLTIVVPGGTLFAVLVLVRRLRQRRNAMRAAALDRSDAVLT